MAFVELVTHCSLDEVDLVNIVKPVSRGVCKELGAGGSTLRDSTEDVPREEAAHELKECSVAEIG